MADVEIPGPEAPAPKRARSQGGMGAIYNALAVVFLALSGLIGLYILMALVTSAVIPGPLRPATLPAVALLPTLPPRPTNTPTSVAPTLPPEWTATSTPTLTPITPSPTPSNTPTQTPTRTPRGPTATATDTPTATRTPSRTPPPTATGPTPTPTRTRSPFPYTLQNGSPTYLSNFANTAGCSWMGIAGQAFNLEGKPQVGLLVHLEGGGLNLDVLTGSKPVYGPAGYEFAVNNRPVETSDTYRVQLRDSAGGPLSEVYLVATKSTCDKNLVLVNFVQNH